MKFPVLQTDRLLLRRLTDEDKEALFIYQSNKDNFPYVSMPVYQDISEVDAYLKKMDAGIEEGKWLLWGISIGDELIGTISLWNFNQARTQAELGFGLFPIYRQQGFMKEAITCLENYGFETLKLEAIEAYTNVVNPDSNGLMQFLGYRLVKTIEEYGEKLNVYRKDR